MSGPSGRSSRGWSAPPTARMARTASAAAPRLDAARLGPSREPFQVLRDPAVQDNQLLEDDETTDDEPPPGSTRRCRSCPTASPRTTPAASILPEHDQR